MGNDAARNDRGNAGDTHPAEKILLPITTDNPSETENPLQQKEMQTQVNHAEEGTNRQKQSTQTPQQQKQQQRPQQKQKQETEEQRDQGRQPNAEDTKQTTEEK